jgi:hypothetical protein
VQSVFERISYLSNYYDLNFAPNHLSSHKQDSHSFFLGHDRPLGDRSTGDRDSRALDRNDSNLNFPNSKARHLKLSKQEAWSWSRGTLLGEAAAPLSLF